MCEAMDRYKKHVLSIFAAGAFIALAVGSSAPTPEEEKKRAEEAKDNRRQHDEWVERVGVAYREVAGIDKTTLVDKPCNGVAMLKAVNQERYISVPTVYGPFLARFASAKKADWKEDEGPWAFVTESGFRDHFAKHADDRNASEVDSTARFIINDWRKYRYLIVLWPEDEKANALPSLGPEPKSFASGRFDGWIMLVDSVDAKVVCQKKLSVTNSDSVSSNESFIKSPKNAIQKDFEDRFEAAIEAALPPEIKSSNNMGSVLE
jgi:hypothetical protein